MLRKIFNIEIKIQYCFDFNYRKYCGRNSPKFIYALQQLVQFSNEFIQDPSTVELAQVKQ